MSRHPKPTKFPPFVASTPATPRPTATTDTPWLKRTPLLNIPNWIYLVIVVLIAGSIIGKFQHTDTTPTPAGPGVEFCASMRDPANASLTAGDFRRIGHWKNSEMMTYVAVHCPDQLDRLRS